MGGPMTACVGIFMLLIDITLLNVALPEIERSLHSASAIFSGGERLRADARGAAADPARSPISSGGSASASA